MDIVPKFKAIIKNDSGKSYLSFVNRGAYEKYMGQFSEDESVVVTIRRISKFSGDGIRKFYFKVIIKLICDYTGDAPLDEHERMKERFSDCDHVFSKESTASDQEKRDFCDRVAAFAWHEHGVFIPNENEVDY